MLNFTLDDAPGTRVCPFCGAATGEGSFCPECGARIDGVAAETQALNEDKKQPDEASALKENEMNESEASGPDAGDTASAGAAGAAGATGATGATGAAGAAGTGTVDSHSEDQRSENTDGKAEESSFKGPSGQDGAAANVHSTGIADAAVCYTDPLAGGIVSTAQWFGIMLLLAIPVVNFIMLIVWAACARRKSLSNFAKASLIWVLVVFIISFLAVATLFVLVALGVIVIPEQWNDYTYWANNFGLSA